MCVRRLRWQREAGLMSRARRRWLSEKPRCADAAGGFLSVRLADVLPALQVRTRRQHAGAACNAIGEGMPVA